MQNYQPQTNSPKVPNMHTVGQHEVKVQIVLRLQPRSTNSRNIWIDEIVPEIWKNDSMQKAIKIIIHYI